MSIEHSRTRAGKDARAGSSYTVAEFCEAERKSRSALYKEWQQGIGPRYYWNGNSRRITPQARADYHRDREGAASREQEARVRQARKATGTGLIDRKGMDARCDIIPNAGA